MSEESLRPTNELPKVLPHEMREFVEREAQERADDDRQYKQEKKAPTKQDAQGAKKRIRAENVAEDEIPRQRPPLAETYREIWGQVAPGSKRGRAYGELITLQTFEMAAKRDLKAIIEIVNRMGGTPLPSLPEKEPPRPKENLDLTRLSVDDLRTLDKVLAKAKTWQENDEKLVAATKAAKAFTERPTAEHLAALQRATSILMEPTSTSD